MSALIDDIEDMLEKRAAYGNAQSKHGFEAAYAHERFLFVEALERLMDSHGADTQEIK